jgi:hypothetical protein
VLGGFLIAQTFRLLKEDFLPERFSQAQVKLKAEGLVGSKDCDVSWLFNSAAL